MPAYRLMETLLGRPRSAHGWGVRARRFVRWATLLSSGGQMVVFLRETFGQITVQRAKEQVLDQDAIKQW